MKAELNQIIRRAGDIILEFYGDKSYEQKEDTSPFTKADKASHEFLIKALRQIKNIPILSEEDITSYEIRKDWQEFWLIDPLDGTKEFINLHDDFCINIALIRECRPVLGVIYAPAHNELYLAEEGKGFVYQGVSKPQVNNQNLTVATSRFHHSELTNNFMLNNNLEATITIGSALKFGRMALGEIDIYPRFEGSKEWDTAAGQIILKETGCYIMDLNTGFEPSYNKNSIRNNFFISCRSSVDVNKLKFPSFV